MFEKENFNFSKKPKISRANKKKEFVKFLKNE
jgi:hypothetical protein